VPVPERRVAAERLAPDHRARDRAVHVQVADRRTLDDALDRVRVAREQAAGQRERQLVDAIHRGVDVPRALDREDRPEDLLAQHGRVGGQVGGDGGRDEPAAVGHAVAALGGDAAGLRRERPVALDPLACLLLDHRRHVGAEGVGLADEQPVDGAGDALEQGVGDRLVDEDARGRRALLPGVDERALNDRGHRVVEVRVAVDDHAVLAAPSRPRRA